MPQNIEVRSNTLRIKRGENTILMEHDYTDSTEGKNFVRGNIYNVHQIGVLKDARIIDTTGAGDAFIGAFLLAKYAGLGGDEPNGVQQAMAFATWVSGKKLEGVGAQSSLPRGADVDQQLAMDMEGVTASLRNLIGRQFNNKTAESTCL